MRRDGGFVAILDQELPKSDCADVATALGCTVKNEQCCIGDKRPLETTRTVLLFPTKYNFFNDTDAVSMILVALLTFVTGIYVFIKYLEAAQTYDI